MNFSQKIVRHWHNLEARFIPAKAWDSDLLTLWRERIIFFFFFFAAVFGPFALIPSLFLSINEGLWTVFFLDSAAYSIVVLVVLFSRKISLQSKTWITFIIFYSLGTGLSFILGFYGAGYIWLFGASLIVGAMIGLKAAGLALLINLFSLVVIGIHIAVGSPEWSLSTENAIEKWTVMTVNFMFINSLITLLIAGMLDNLKTALTREQETAIELREKREELMAIFKASPDPVLVYDSLDHVQYLNNAFATTFGWHLDEVKGKKIPFIPEGEQNISRDIYLNDIGKDKNAIHFETKRYTKDGNLLDISLSASPIKGNKETTVGLVVNMKDTTEFKKIEAQLQQSQKMEAIGTLAGGIAHDFNNILTSILGFSELTLLDLPDDSKAKKNISQVIASGRRATDLVRQILTFSRKEPRSLKLIDPHIVVKEVLKMLRSSLPTTVKIEEEIDLECGEVQVDPTQLHQVVMNLCTNAFHAMEDQKGTLQVELQRMEVDMGEAAEDPTALDGPFIVLSVSDTGCGMDQATKERIFDPYFTTKETGKGTGLGLAVIHGIVESFSGFIKVESEPGCGTTFQVYIPARENKINLLLQKTDEDGSLPVGTERIMVVDDEDSILDLHEMVLKRLGYKVTAITDSRVALEKIHAHPDQYDLLLSDQSMPNLSGAELSREVLKIRSTMPIILCTGYSSIVSEKDALAIGIKKYVKKPVGLKKLAVIIRQVLDEG